ncbi:crossover junction endonuclease EME1 isoform X1 [Prorops nasuta]|uniref:crossover junction endonuclease EME1 isoform X1 n=1 Tax=Prorops nasuta TaxID=863751 RepID=UPI0034CD6C8B
MSEPIILSDSNDSTKEDNEFTRESSIKPSLNSIYTLEDFDFPAVEFSYVSDNIQKVAENIEDSGEEIGEAYNRPPANKNFKLFHKASSNSNILKRSNSCSEFESEPEDCILEKDKLYTNSNLTQKSFKNKKALSNNNKDKKKEERIQRQNILSRKKALKKAQLENEKNLKPGECIKAMEVVIDEGIINFPFYNEIALTLRNNKISYTICPQLIPNCITWKRNIQENFVDEKNEIQVTIVPQIEKQAIVIWDWKETIKKIADKSFNACVSNFRILKPDHTFTLIIYNIQKYFSYLSKEIDNRNSKRINTKEKESYPNISRKQVDMCLTQIQIIANCNTRLIENSQDLTSMLYQYTKAIAETPSRLQKKQNIEQSFDWYVSGDKKGTIIVDKFGNGLKRLWQQQLCQFNLTSLEIAEAIYSVYSSPMELVSAYEQCTEDKGAKLLKDLPIRRAAGPLTTVRRIGPELSKKIYMMFTVLQGEKMLGNC